MGYSNLSDNSKCLLILCHFGISRCHFETYHRLAYTITFSTHFSCSIFYAAIISKLLNFYYGYHYQLCHTCHWGGQNLALTHEHFHLILLKLFHRHHHCVFRNASLYLEGIRILEHQSSLVLFRMKILLIHYCFTNSLP